jgi:MFS family permease
MEMTILVYITFVILLVLCAGLQCLALKGQNHPTIGNNQIFLKFQYIFFAAYFAALLADWLQGPYLYQLYSHYGFLESQIAIIYSCGFASTVILGTWAPIAADRFGRRKLCIFFTIIYSVSCFTKLSRNYGVLIVGRVLGGMATSLLFYTFEAWYIHEHIEGHDFPREWIPVTFTKTTVWNGALSVLAGFIANMISEWFHFGPVSPFMLAIPFLLISGIIVMSQWQENYGRQTIHFRKSYMDGLREILSEERIFFIGAIQSLFESVMYIFVFIWTPVLNRDKPPLGIVFSCFMVCIMIGAAIFQLLRGRKISVVTTLSIAICFASAAMITCVFAVGGGNGRKMSFFAFLLLEIGVGIYFPSMGFIRMKVIPEQHRASISSWFRVPLNLIACAVLTVLHGTSYRYGNRMIFMTCAGLLAIAMMCLLRFGRLIRANSELKTQNEEEEELIEMETVA